MSIIPSKEAQAENDAARADNLSRRVLELEAALNTLWLLSSIVAHNKDIKPSEWDELAKACDKAQDVLYMSRIRSQLKGAATPG